MWFKNINTGLTWEIHDERTIQDLQNNDNFIEVEEPTSPKQLDKETKTSKRNNPNQTKFVNCEICGRECRGQRSHTQHLRMAHGIKKDGDK